MASPLRGANGSIESHPLMTSSGGGRSSATNSLLRSTAAQQNGGFIKSSADMVRVYNYGGGPSQMGNGVRIYLHKQSCLHLDILWYFVYVLQKDIMFRSAGGGYSPATASESSGFSEAIINRDRGFSPPNAVNGNHTSTFLPLHMRPGGGAASNFDGHAHFNLNGRGSPQLGPHSYHNPALTASPYSTLPRRPLNGHAPPPLMAASVGRNSPLLELTGYGRSSSLGRNSSLTIKEEPENFGPSANTSKNQKISNTSLRSPLLTEDRESCV